MCLLDAILHKLVLHLQTLTTFPNVTARTPNWTQYIAPINFPSQPGYWSTYASNSNWAAVVCMHCATSYSIHYALNICSTSVIVHDEPYSTQHTESHQCRRLHSQHAKCGVRSKLTFCVLCSNVQSHKAALAHTFALRHCSCGCHAW